MPAFSATSRKATRAPGDPRTQVLVLVDPRSSATHEVEPMMGIQQYVADRGLPWKVRFQMQVPRDLLKGGRRVDGIIGRATPRTVLLARRHRVPMVNILGSAAPAKVPSVIADYEAAGRMAADFLLERGLRQAAFLGADLRYSERLRKGFAGRIEAAGGACLCETTAFEYEASPATFDRFERRIRGFVERLVPPVGILAFEDMVCHYVADACTERGLHVPDDVAIVGLGNDPILCLRLAPSLTSVDCNFSVVGYRAAELLARLMAGERPPRETVLVAPRAIVPRRSTEHLFTDDPLVAQALRHISAHHAGRLRPRDVARHLSTSLRTLQRRFEGALGRSVIGEINRQRARHARQLLVDGDALVKEIAHECGFTDAQQFGRVFTELEGMTPTDYRRAHRK